MADLSMCGVGQLVDELEQRILDALVDLAQRRDAMLTDAELIAALEVRTDHERQAAREDVSTP